MPTRIEILAAIDAVPEAGILTINQIAKALDKPINTVSGWLSNSDDFPIAKRGPRSQKHYNKLAFTKLCLYVYAMNPEGSLSVKGQAALAALNKLHVPNVLEYLRQGDAQFFAVFNRTA